MMMPPLLKTVLRPFSFVYNMLASEVKNLRTPFATPADLPWYRRAIITYKNLIEFRAPLITTASTIATTYVLGEGVAEMIGQGHLDWKRLAVFGVYGLFLGGPAYFFWFKYLDKVPGQLLVTGERFRGFYTRSLERFVSNFQISVNGQVVPPSAVTFKFTTKLAINKWIVKAVKICMDQFMFSSLYTLFIMVAIGKMTGESNHEISEKVRNKYWTIYKADCIVWPPAQLINFTYVPPQLQPIYVNVLNILWNAYLSFQLGGH